MTQVGEGVAVPAVDQDKCPICEKAPHPDRTTTDKKEGKGCLKSIPKNLGCTVIPYDPQLPNYATAAHHLIPANQCLKAFPRLSQMCDTVGYDVNNSINGLALPTCGQRDMNAYTDRKIKYGRLDDVEKKDVAFVIMEGLNLQWHVGHHNWKLDLETDGAVHPVNYDKLVKTKLRDLEKELIEDGEDVCEPDSGESGADVIGDLNSLSAEIRAKVVSWSTYFVSNKSCLFAKAHHN
jgi:hypothetical protein